MRLWPVLYEATGAASAFGFLCYDFAFMSLPVSYTLISFSLFSLYVQAFGLMAMYRRSIPSIRQYYYLLVIMFILDCARMILYPPVQNLLPTPEQELQIFNLDLDSILSANPADPASITDLLFEELSLAEALLASIITVALDIWLCKQMVQDLEKIEAEEAQARVQAQAQTQAQIRAHTQSQTSSERTPSALEQELHEKQD
ncbi:hypothetical protein BG006_000586 [Podila minutissima]|uniref:Uncharacterized protein n=1 Tax=Podila minutissima TaxID=64525 RepID=A0A9P5SXJ5_9FUNG|nr:hypothetical protein BG006_000586 [Podila minutissima]